MKMIAYHGDESVKARLLVQLQGHYALDQIVKGQYWEDGKGCAVVAQSIHHAMSNDMMILQAVNRGFIEVDFEQGLAYSKRFGGRQVGCLNKPGYKVFTLHLDGMRRQVKLHRVIWIAKNGVPCPGMVIDHINRNKSDNRLVNLRLADAKLNAANRRDYNGNSNPAAKINPLIASEIRGRYMPLCSYAKVAAEFSVSKSLVAQIIRGELWK